ncbi:MAG: L-serine ammonia-lyase, iron-sulfur-dependent subunit beta [Verrucomicrobiota bacterium]
MSFSTFEIIGPPMIGPSSSHTAGACRIGWICRELLGELPEEVEIGLHGSFFSTGQGHATDQALIAGILGFPPDDVRLKDSFEHAEKAGLKFSFHQIDLGPQAHPNSAQLKIRKGKNEIVVTAESVGGGSILLRQIGPFSVEIRGALETLVIWHLDTPGFLSRITAVLACAELNVASIRTSRFERGEQTLTTIEIDGTFPSDVLAVIQRSRTIQRLVRLPILPGF